MVERRIPDFFQCPKNYSEAWDKAAYEDVFEWLIKELNKYDIEAPQTVNQLARKSKKYRSITKEERNSQPVRYMLSILYQTEYVDFKNNLTFCLKKRITFLSLFKKRLNII